MVVETLSAAQAEVPGRIRMDSWPALPDESAEQSNQNPSAAAAAVETEADNDWNFIDDPDDDEALAEEKMKAGKGVRFNPKILHRCASTPDFGNYDDEPSPYVDSSEDAANISPSPKDASGAEEANGSSEEATADQQPAAPKPEATAATPSTSAWGGGARRPSFRDMILLNAEKTAAEAEAAEKHRAETAALLKKEREEHRRARGLRTRLVVTPIKRCAKSTGNLRALDHIQEHHDDEEDYCGGGGGGGGFSGPIVENDHDVLGDTDAQDFYHRKNKGIQNRVAGEKIRPDELKRKEISQYKRDAQRKAQQDRQGSSGGGKAKAEQQHKLGGKALSKAERQAAAAKGGKKGRQKK